VVLLAERSSDDSETGSFFERTSKLASRRLRRELERSGTLGEFALEPRGVGSACAQSQYAKRLSGGLALIPGFLFGASART
jgi:hypothetical protein